MEWDLQLREAVRKSNLMRGFLRSAVFLYGLIALAGCKASYPEDSIVRDLQKICREEYGIDRIEVKMVGNTLGVYLPLEKLFTADLQDVLGTADPKDLANLLQLSPHALDKVEDVLFSTSRVMLSTDRPFRFYVLEATDTKSTGITLKLVGYVDDIKRVRFWDISRGEYKKRIYYDLKVNHVVVWRKPILGLFSDLESLPLEDVWEKYFLPGIYPETLTPIFYSYLLEGEFKTNQRYEILETRATNSRINEAMVYVKIKETYTPKPGYEKREFLFPSGSESEYIFVVTKYLKEYRISRVIPFHYMTADRQIKQVDFPKELKLYESIEKWKQEFTLEDIPVESFLADQITRRAQTLLSLDERIENTFSRYRIDFAAANDVKEEQAAPDDPEKPVDFALTCQLKLKDELAAEAAPISRNEDVLYLLDVAVREFAAVIRAYSFPGFRQLEVKIDNEHFILNKDHLELFRRKKLDVAALFEKGGFLPA